MRTTTAVHGAASDQAQRRRAQAYADEMTVSLALSAQVLAYGALYILPAAATAAWWAVLALLLPWAALRLLGWGIRRTAPPAAVQSAAYRLAAGGMAVLFWSNMAVCLLSLIELTHVFFFPDGSRLLLSLAAALGLGLGLPARDAAVSNLARPLRIFLIAAFGFCVCTVLPSGEAGYLFPLAGYGVLPTLRCAALGAGGVWMAGALAILLPDRQPVPPLRAALPGALSIVSAALLFLVCAYVLPGTALNFRPGYALRLQIVMEMSPNTLSWSLMLMAEMLLFLAGFTFCCDLMRRCLHAALGVSRLPTLPFALACVPPAVIGMGTMEPLLIRLLPWRYPAAALLMLLCLTDNLIKRRKRARQNE